MSKVQELPVFGEGRYLKKCSKCKKEFRTDARNARFGPPELCKCLENRAKNRAKRRKERRKYHKDPEKYRALSRTRAASRKLLTEHCEKHGIVPKCNQCGKYEGELKKLHCHHRDDNPFNLFLESYPLRSNLEWVCRTCHEKCDHAKDYGLVLYQEPAPLSFMEFLVQMRRDDPRKFYFTLPNEKYEEWMNSGTSNHQILA